MRRAEDDTPVLTGVGVVTGLGFGVAANQAALAAGRTAVRAAPGEEPVARVEPPYLRAAVPEEMETQVKFLNGAGLLAVEASIEACGAAGWRGDDEAPERRGLWLSQMDAWDWSCIALRDAFVDATESFSSPLDGEALNTSATRRVKPFFMLESLKNNAFSFLAGLFDLRGPNTGTAGFDTTSLVLLDLAARAVARGDLERALVVGAGRITEDVARLDVVLHGLARPAGRGGAYRPLEAGGTGVAPGEGAAALCLETLEGARARGVRPLATLLGSGAATGDPLPGVPAPTAATLHDSIETALEAAAAGPGDVLAALLPGYGLAEADRAQLEALGGCRALDGVPALVWRGATGHTALACDLVDVALAADALRAGRLPGTPGLATPLDVGGRPIAGSALAADGRGVLVVSAGFGGQAAAVVLGPVG